MEQSPQAWLKLATAVGSHFDDCDEPRLKMAGTSDRCVTRRRAWQWYVGLSFVALFVVAAVIGAWMLYTGVTVSLQAERNLHATIFTIRLVDQFVHEKGRWPSSWNELEQMPFPGDAPLPRTGELTVVRIGGSHGYDWPAQAQHLQDCVSIDFGADANTIVAQDPMEFDAIKPIGPYYEYRDYGFVESLQQTLKATIADAVPPEHD